MPGCWKISYPTRAAAKQAVREIKRSGKPAQRPYQCKACHLWHLTSAATKADKSRHRANVDHARQRREMMMQAMQEQRK